MGEGSGVYRVSVGKSEEKDHLENSGLVGNIIIKWFIRKWDVGAWIGSTWLRIGTCSGHVLMR